ncbi:MAG: beta-glucosidase BglX [Bryobacterales bacterium]|nr:beta-glucosidase BglX [Bryobacterales bacterium]
MLHRSLAGKAGLCAIALSLPLLPAPPANPHTTKAQALLQRMTLEEKIGQLSQIGGINFIPDALTPEQRVRLGQAGSILWLSDPAAINKLQRVAVEETRLHIPLIFGLDVIHGFKTIFPIPLAMAASWDPALIEKVQSTAAREARASGIHWTFAPMVDITRDPRWGRMIEGAGEDPFLGSAIARAQVRGFQGSDLSSPDRVLACAKHFAGYGAADGGRDYDSSYIPEDQMWNVYLPPFHAALQAGAGTFMSAYMDLNDVPGTANRFLLQTVLRKTWGFQGFVVSDANSVGDLTTHGFARDKRDAAYRALTAGVNMDMASRTYLDHLGELVKQRRLPVSVIDNAVLPILAAKYQLGLFEHPYADEALARQIVGAADHAKVAREAAVRSAVLLRNERQLLPLDKRAGRSIAVIGPLADSQRDLYSMWASFSGDFTKVTTVAQAIRAKLGAGARVESAPGVELRKIYPSMFDRMFGGPPKSAWTPEQADTEFKKAVDLASRSDVVVLVMGELSAMNGESASQTTLDLPGRQLELMQAVAATGKFVVLVLINGRPLDISWAAGHIPAILEAWHPGQEGGNAVADLLFGDAAPGGKLPFTWPRSAGQIPLYYAHNLTHQPDSAKDFGSRYWDSPSSPLYPFGYGLGYTRFAISNLRVRAAQVPVGGKVEVTVDVENTGSRAGEEVVQLYIHQQAGAASRPVRQLKGFARVSLQPGEKKTLPFSLGNDELTYWSAEQKKWIVEAENFDVWAGADSNATLHSTFRLIPPAAR